MQKANRLLYGTELEWDQFVGLESEKEYKNYDFKVYSKQLSIYLIIILSKSKWKLECKWYLFS